MAQRLAAFRRVVRDQIRQALACRLRTAREEAGLTQRALAKRLWLTNVAVHKIETGVQKAEVAVLCEWAAACGVDPLELLRQVIEPPRGKEQLASDRRETISRLLQRTVAIESIAKKADA